MIYLYLISLVIGGGLLGVSIVLGGHDAPHDVHVGEALAPAGQEAPLGGAQPCNRRGARGRRPC